MRRYSALLFFVLSLLPCALCAEPAQELFLQGNKAYQEKDYQQALQKYQSIPCKGSAVWYNMGNCYYHEDQQISALVCWRRAQRQAPTKLWRMSEKNCRHINQRLALGSQDTVGEQIVATFNRIGGRVALIWYQLIFLFIWAILLVLGVRLYQSKKIWILTALILLTLLSFSTLFMKYYLHNQQLGIIVRNVDLYAGPDSTYHTVGSCSLGQSANIKNERDQWYYVQDRQAHGWVQKDACEFI